MTENNPVRARFVRTGVDGILHLFMKTVRMKYTRLKNSRYGLCCNSA